MSTRKKVTIVGAGMTGGELAGEAPNILDDTETLPKHTERNNGLLPTTSLHSEAMPPDLTNFIARQFKELRDDLSRLIADIIRDELREQHTVQPENYDSKEAATYLNISPRKLDELVAGGYLKPLRIGRKRLFPVEQLRGLLRAAAAGTVR